MRSISLLAIFFILWAIRITPQIEAGQLYKGGYKKLSSDIKDKLFLPPYVPYKCIQGPIYLEFLLHPDKKVDSIKITKSLNRDCDSAVILALSQVRGWVKVDTPTKAELVFVIEHHHSACKNSDYYTKEGIDLYNKKEYNKAYEQFNLALKINPLKEEALFGRGMCLINMGNVLEGCIDLEMAAEMGHKEAGNVRSMFCK